MTSVQFSSIHACARNFHSASLTGTHAFGSALNTMS